MVSHLSSFRYIEADKGALDTYFQAPEIANATFVEGFDTVEKVSLSFTSLKSVKSTVENGSSEG